MQMEAEILTLSPIQTDNEAAAAVAAPRLFPLDQWEFEIKINVQPEADKPLFVTHALRRPTEAELLARSLASSTETRLTQKGEYSLPEGDDAPDVALYDKIMLYVIGYRLADGVAATEPRSNTPQLVQRIPASHKLAALRGLYASECEIIADEEADSFDLENDSLAITQNLGSGDIPDFVLTHFMRVPSEAARTKFARNKKTRKTVGIKKGAKLTEVENLKVYIDFYNDHFSFLTGAEINGTPTSDLPREQVLAYVDAQFKHQVVEKLMKSFEAGLQD